ncbi:hypothetical protein BLNAU_19331 [Blattamonas nauphoetae]|uniref:Uncharacterized protein n=1 Tax=Blattamonas nauphoetae TaxID=2049346 RepID=A0ABQ9X2A7_9EUKA|nr:hypothetical protein BLNAU_19331 [Blattamonas nauphoetae]
MTHRNYLAGMTPTHFRGLPLRYSAIASTLLEVGCSFRFVVLNVTVFDCHIFDRPLSTQFLAYLFFLSLPSLSNPITKQAILQILNDSAENVAEEGGRGKAVGDEDLIAVVNNAHAHLLIM